MDIPAIYGERQTFSSMRISELSERIRKTAPVQDLHSFTIFTAGSYGRLEASTYSDIDLFFLYSGSRSDRESPNIAELKLFGSLIETVESMGFPKFSNDGQYLTTLSSAQILEHLGSPRDDYENLFTLRMLMLLESKCLYGDESYTAILNEIITSYYRDYPDHQATFEPWFLLNDIGRFWKTLLLNYENKRNQNGTDTDTTKQKVRNFKLKYSRMTTCFATVAALGSFRSPVHGDTVLELIQRTPRQRLEVVAEEREDLRQPVEDVLTGYAWFLEQTALSQDALYALFEDKAQRVEMFRRANEFGDKMFTLLERIDRDTKGETTRFLRFLVI